MDGAVFRVRCCDDRGNRLGVMHEFYIPGLDVGLSGSTVVLNARTRYEDVDPFGNIAERTLVREVRLTPELLTKAQQLTEKQKQIARMVEEFAVELHAACDIQSDGCVRGGKSAG